MHLAAARLMGSLVCRTPAMHPWKQNSITLCTTCILPTLVVQKPYLITLCTNCMFPTLIVQKHYLKPPKAALMTAPPGPPQPSVTQTPAAPLPNPRLDELMQHWQRHPEQPNQRTVCIALCTAPPFEGLTVFYISCGSCISHPQHPQQHLATQNVLPLTPPRQRTCSTGTSSWRYAMYCAYANSGTSQRRPPPRRLASPRRHT